MIPEPDDREAFAAFLLRLRGKGVVAKSLIAAFEATPRRLFLPLQFQSAAWSEGMVPIECGEAIEGADYQAQLLATLAPEPGHRVLEIGSGSGYTAALMSRLAARIVTLERYKTLTELARQRFEQLGLTNVAVRQAESIPLKIRLKRGAWKAPNDLTPADLAVSCARCFASTISSGTVRRRASSICAAAAWIPVT